MLGYGGLFDALSIRIQDSRSGGGVGVGLNPVLILSFVESVLGYESVPSSSSSGNESQWYFKRVVAFRG